MTQYLNKSFTVGMPAGKEYRDNWDRIFGKKESPEPCNWSELQWDSLKLMTDCGRCEVCDRMFSHLRTEEEKPQNGQPQ